MLKFAILAAGLFATASSALAQQLPAGAGAQLQQIPPPPVLQKSIPEIRIEGRGAPPVPNAFGSKVLVNSLRITGATKFSEPQLIAAADFKSGTEMDLTALRAMAAKISNYYLTQGYLVAQAYLCAKSRAILTP